MNCTLLTDTVNKRIPDGLVEYFLSKNKGRASDIRSYFDGYQQQSKNVTTSSTGLISFTHFLPSKHTLPDWVNTTSDDFSKGWFDHGVPGVSAKFAKVAGSNLIDEEIRSIRPEHLDSNSHIHVFGHSHRPKDFYRENIRYIHNPLGKPREREMGMISHDINFQLIWDTSMGQIPSEQVIRYWEERGGGKLMVWRHMLKRKQTRERTVKSIRNAISMLKE